MILAARGLTIGYRQRIVGQGLDLSLAEGEVLALLGPNGGGKTTLLKTVLGLIAPLAGEIMLAGQEMRGLGVRDRARLIAYVPQIATLAFAFTVEELVLMGRSAHGDLFSRPSARDRAVAAAAIERLGIGHLAARPCTEISGGERQLALIARALAQEPRIVVLDEPTASLDFGNQGKVMREIRAMAERRLAVIFSTHDPNHALRYADEVLLLRDGRCLASGPARSLLTAAQLHALYGTEIRLVEGGGDRAYLPG